MAYEDRQEEFPLPGENPQKRESARHLPKYFRTDKNNKFLQSTLDQILQPGVAEKINSFVGRKTAKAFTPEDSYLDEISNDRKNYQLEPVSVIKDNLGNVQYLRDYTDYINQIGNFLGNNSNHSRNNQQEFYTWDPHIDWDKFTNFREYYWLPNGPQTVVVPGERKEIASTYTVGLQEALGDYSYLFTPDGLTNNPTLKLYRGVKYRFEINTPGLPFTFRTVRTLEDEFLLNEGVSQQNVEEGVIELVLGPGTSNEIFYVASNDINVGGIIKVANSEEATVIDVEAEIIGKKFYTTRDGWEFTNGLKIRFEGEVIPSKYANSEWYIEGVGEQIKLVSDIDVEVSFPVGIDLVVPFDGEEGFDRLPFGTATGYPRDKDYITINRASGDGNFWSRYNRWFHREVIDLAAKVNDSEVIVDQSQRANRPIIEFEAGLKLYNFGTRTKQVIDLIDDFTADAFSTIEGSLGYNIDSIQLTEGMRVLFLADTDPLVKGKIFEVRFIQFRGSGTQGQISLVETFDSNPQPGENVLVTNGENYSGSMWYFDGSVWNRAQEKTAVNQPPVFDVFDVDGNSYANTSIYPASSFRGTKLFSYREGSGKADASLGFPLSYRSIDNVGDIVFDFNFNSDVIEYQIQDETFRLSINKGFLRKYNSLNQYFLLGAYTKSNELSYQEVILQYVNDGTRITYPINCYNRSAFISDLKVKVFVNNNVLREGTDYELIDNADKFKAIKFITQIAANANIVIKTRTSTPKNENGYYEIAPNLEKNPLNQNVQTLTLGEVTDHVLSITQTVDNFNGIFPGTSNLRDISNLSKYGRKFVKHSSPLNLAMYSTLDRDSNIIKSLRFSKKEYSKYKRQFLEIAETLGFDGPVKQHVDKLIEEISKDKTNKMPFYFSDMIPYGASITTRITIEDQDANFYALTVPFTLENLSTRGVTVYLNDVQLIHERDYVFNNEGFLEVTAQKSFGDILEINEYEITNGSFIPPTPTKLGLYPKYVPEIFVDDTYTEAPTLIRGHDGSLTRAFGDFRDDLILELEKRIFNNIKIKYDRSVFDIHDYVPSAFRNTGFSRDDVYGPMISDFVQWLQLVDEDYTDHRYFDRLNPFTFNYSSMSLPTGEKMPGWWRGVYKHLFDTDRPHTNPWEMLGFSIKPIWWDEQYGPAPYTNENLLLWEDLEKGIIREPGKPFKINLKYARPGLSKFLPVDADGNLISPSDANVPLRFDSTSISESFIFGDQSPIESAWTNSSEYPFAILTSWAINSPARFFASGFDRSRQIRDTLGHLVYSTTMDQLTLKDLVFPNTSDDNTQVLTAGLVNYIAAYMASSITSSFKNYATRLKSIKNCLAFKLGGFTDKSKFKLILDSRTPLNKGNVFVPEENYQIVLNSSSPIKTINYSGIIVEKTSKGFIIRGYNKENPVFNFYQPVISNRDVTVNVGGISEPYTFWEPQQTYIKGKNVEYQGDFYKVIITYTSTGTFDPSKHSKIPRLPTIGGADAIFRNRFYNDRISTISYGTLLKTVQDVVDFLLGYEAWLIDQGFRFEYYDGEEKVLSDWKNSAREFMFWTTQNWSEGAIIALSPVADEINFETEYSIVDNVFDNFYGYSLLKSDGKKLVDEFIRISRQDPNKFKLRPKKTADGVYAVQIPLIQKEHVVLIDNTSVFGDIIYQPATGYRQERIKAFGYRTTDWDGSLNIPGFIYSESKFTEWEQWKDYSVGDIVKYKEFYYTADKKISGNSVFDSSDWVRLDEKPESKLLTNFEYKVNQFADFYDLDTDNFDIEQQNLAQHLIGYQKRDYLENIINDDVSQYKFYQGMIREKGSRNSLDKLFDVLSAADKESLDFYEEWAIKQGQYGASEGFEEVEFRLDERKFRLEPQPFLLTNEDTNSTDLVYRIKDFEVFKKPKNYLSSFPLLNEVPQFTRSPGYVHRDDANVVVESYDKILDLPFSDIKNGDYVWVNEKNNSWNIYQHRLTDSRVLSLKGNAVKISIGAPDANQFIISLDNAPKDIKVGDIIGIYDLIITDDTIAVSTQTTAPVEGFFKVLKVSLNEVVIDTNLVINDINQCKGLITKFVSVRAEDYKQANEIAEEEISKGSLLWVDNNGTGNWSVIKNNMPYNLLQKIPGEESGQQTGFGTSLAVDNRNVTLAIASPGADNDTGKVFVYTRGGNAQNYQFVQILDLDDGFADSGIKFGEGLAISNDGKYIIVGSPNASNVKTKFNGEFDPFRDYQNTEIVRYSDQLWEALVDINGARLELPFGSFGSIIEVYQKYNITAGEIKFNNLLMGNYPFKNIETDHILVRAFADQYAATGPGDKVFIDWYSNTTANQEQEILEPRAPFDGAIPEVTEEFLESGLIVDRKIDAILFINSIATVPENPIPGVLQLETQGATGYFAYGYVSEGQATVYVENSLGTWPASGSLFLETGEFVGEFVRVAPIENLDTEDDLGGYWMIPIGQDVTVGEVNEDEGRALAVYNVIPAGKANPNGEGGNIYDLNNDEQFQGENAINSYIRTLTYQGSPGAGGDLDPITSDLYVVRASKKLTDRLNPGDEVGLSVVNLPRYSDGSFVDITVTGLTYIDTNKKHILEDLWDGYIDFELENTDEFGRPYEPRIGQFVRDRRTGATGQVTFYQRNGVNATIFIKRKLGQWSLGTNYGESADIEFLGDPNDPSPIYAVTRRLGDIKATSLGSDSLGIGKMCVFKLGSDIIEVPSQDTVIGAEYIIYKDFEILGVATEPNVPAADNFDWRPVYNVPAAADGESVGLSNYGMFTVFVKENVSTFTPIGTFIVPEKINNLRLGSNIKIAKRNNLYKAFIGCAGDGTEQNPGRIYFVNNGIDDNGIGYNWELAKDKRYKGEFGEDRRYFIGDIVFLDGEFYIAKTNIAAGDKFNLLDWEFATNDSIRSIDFVGYVPNDTPFVPRDPLDPNWIGNQGIPGLADSSLQIDRTGLIKFGEEFDVSDNGEVLVVKAEYSQGSDKVIVYRNINDSYLKTQEINIGIDQHSTQLSISQDGMLFAVSNPYATTDKGENQGAVYVYKQVNGEFVFSQTLTSTNPKRGEEFGAEIDFDGRTLYVSAFNASSDDTTTFDSYGNNLRNVFVKNVTPRNPAVLEPVVQDGKIVSVNIVNQGFGYKTVPPIQIVDSEREPGTEAQVTLVRDDLGRIVSAQINNAGTNYTSNATISVLPYPVYTNYILNSDSEELDNKTTFDNEFTGFRNTKAINGVVYVYDRIDEDLVFGQTLDYNDKQTNFFGRNIKCKNNHMYVSIPQYENNDGNLGLVLDYRRPDSTRLWEVYRTPNKIPDLSKIKRVMLYDLDKNTILESLDYIDPAQGKIAGLADEELRYKTIFDPAVYTEGTLSNRVDPLNSWGEENVGQLWWDLSTSKFFDVYQGNVIYRTNNFNTLYPGASVDVYEWVKSKYKPEEWDRISAQPEGAAAGITGTSKYGQGVYVQKRVYDSIAQRFVNYYYFWVKNKITTPDVPGRSISCLTVKNLIEDPAKQGYKFIAFLDSSSFALYNCGGLIKGNNTVLSIQYWTFSDRYSNIHNQYQILTEGLSTSVPYPEIEEKWFDSIVGYDSKLRPVPDPKLSVKERYGILNKPRQGWFVNRTEALKQLIERTNNVLIRNLIVEEKNINRLLDFDPAPTAATRSYDIVLDTEIDLQFVGIARAVTATLIPIIENGKIVRVDILNPGRGYRVSPTYKLNGQGQDAEFKFSINDLGQITDVEIVNQGLNYNEDTEIIVRPFAALVQSDSLIRGKWALYHRDSQANTWSRVAGQAYDVTNYWNYTDWYGEGYNEFTEIDHVISQSYELAYLNDELGDIVKILNVSGSGWLLLEKIDEQDTVDYTVNYKTIGKQNGTIQFKDTLYNFNSSRVGFDGQTFDTQFFDGQPIAEIRIILESLKNDIFVNDLATEYNNLFFASLRYVFAEQGYVDWAFKTSFVKAQHNVGALRQKVTFKNDALDSYEKYIKEVKPYKSKIREYVSTYNDVERASSTITDFDSPPRFDPITNQIETNNVIITDGVLQGVDDRYTNYPEKYWLDNLTFRVIDIEISDPGQGYLSAPVIEIEGNATAQASLGPNGIVTSVIITNPGSGYIIAPKITINGSLSEGGRPAILAAKLGNSLVRNTHVTIKFDRVSGAFFITELNEKETFTATGSKTDFDLKWPMDMRADTVEILVDGELILNSKYSYDNYRSTTSSYEKYYGRVSFFEPPKNNATVEISYKKSIRALNAQDRINLFYNPTTGQIGKDVTQLMDGVDYGGVQVKSYGFSGPSGWDTDNWYDGAWDIFDETFDAETQTVYTYDNSGNVTGTKNSFILSAPLQKNVSYNVYISNDTLDKIRVDDEEYDGSSSRSTLDNKNAFMATIIGDGTTSIVTIENEHDYLDFLNQNGDGATDKITIIRSTSDGSLKPNEESFDTALQGGDLAYTTARGIAAEEINVDGDGFVTTTTSKGPEENIPGQILDTLDITVYERPVGGASIMQTSTFRGDGITRTFNLRQRPFSTESVIVKINGSIVRLEGEYRIDYNANEITFYNAPDVFDDIVVISMGVGGNNLLDYDEFTTDGSTQEYLTNVQFTDTVQSYVTVNGVVEPYTLIKSDETYAVTDRCVIRFEQPPLENKLIQFALFEGDDVQGFSQVTVDEIVVDGSSVSYPISRAPFSQEPAAYNVLVMVNDRVLNAGYSEVFTVSTELEFQLKKWQVPVGTVSGSEIEVYLNGRKLQFLQEWTYEGASSFNPDIAPDAQPGSTVILNRGIAAEGDELRVYIISSGEYRFGYFESPELFVSTPGTLYFDEPFNAGDVIRVYQFSNHDSLGIDRQNYDVIEKTQMTVDSAGYYEYRSLSNGLIKLRKPAISSDYVWVALNGRWLTPSSGYDLLENRQYIKFVKPFNESDVVDIIHFSNPPINPKFGWRQFKDMLNRNHYKRLSSEDRYTLAAPLNWYDRTITLVETGDNLPNPGPNSRTPGILFIDKERIEFFRREGNVLKQLRRGTLGTGVKTVYSIGTEVYNQSIDSTIPYKDTEESLTTKSGDYNNMSSIYSNSPDVEVDSIVYDFNNNTVFPLGGQLATVTGAGFRPTIKLYTDETLVEATVPVTATTVDNKLKLTPPFFFQPLSWSQTLTVGKKVKFGGNSVGGIDLELDYYITSIIDSSQDSSLSGNEVFITVSEEPGGTTTATTADTGNMTVTYDSTTYISDTEVKFITIAKAVGAYDLVIVNETEFTPLLRPATSLVKTKFLPYVQVLLPFEPEAFTDVVRNPVETGQWFKDDFNNGGIPTEYWQALDIEVFANGRRLRKNPITVYDVTKGQFSPDGDVQIQAEYAVNRNEGAYVRLTTPPEPNTTLTIVRKRGQIWNEPGVSLGKSNTEIATFLRAKTIDLPR